MPLPDPGPPSSWLKRCPTNPVLTADAVPYPATLVFNAGVTRFGGRYVCVFRNDHGRDGDPLFDGTNLGLAYSEDGLDWSVEPEPLLGVPEARAMLAPHYPAEGFEEEVIRFYDPRLVVLEGRLLLCFAIDTRHGLRSGIAAATKDDLSAWEVLHLTAPDSRNLVLFPEKVGGRYLRLERPMNEYGDAKLNPGKYALWASGSPDLRHWGGTRLVLTAEQVAYANDKIGPAAPPIRTDAGWLCLFHAVSVDPGKGKNGWEPRWQKRYDCGVMLLDLEDPTRVVARAQQPLLVAETPEEREGFRNDVVFPTGLVELPDGRARVYYGAADTVLCAAEARIEDLVAFCHHG